MSMRQRKRAHNTGFLGRWLNPVRVGRRAYIFTSADDLFDYLMMGIKR